MRTYLGRRGIRRKYFFYKHECAKIEKFERIF